MGRRKPRASIYSPRVWGTWLLVAMAWLLVRLPLSVLVPLGRHMGRITYHLARSRRHITHVNLKLCFPEQSEADRQLLARQVFEHVAVGALETFAAWLNPNLNLAGRVQFHGIEHLEAAQALGRGVVLVGGHFTTLDILAPELAKRVEIDVMYRENKNPVWEWLQVQGRRRYFRGVIERSDTRETMRRLKRGRTIWYAADQDYGPKHSVFAPFFGVPAATITATARLAQFNRSPVIFLSHFRDFDTLTWDMTFSPVLEDFPTGDDTVDARRMNALLEQALEQHPEQYLWIHRRFKTRPPGEARPY